MAHCLEGALLTVRPEDLSRRDAFRPTISVCMATYNGERYLEEQIGSILVQLSNGDELIIVDDASSDRTREIIFGFKDSRIHLICNRMNRGVQASFETALMAARSEIVFFSDQDDVWAKHKVAEILKAFEENQEVTLILSDSNVIDAEGNVIADSYYRNRSPFRDGLLANLLHFRYQGCAMAIRRKILPQIMPFPHGYDLLHDLWIGIRNELAGNKVLFIKKPLFSYRRHGLNVSHTMSLARQIKVRFHLLCALCLVHRS